MRILLLADIHANWPALAAIIACEEFDRCLFLGDLVDYATDAVPCIDWIRRNATAAVRGNHDHAVAHRVAPKVGPGLKSLAIATRQWHWKTLSNQDLKYLARLPATRTIELDGRRFYLCHATPRDPLDEHLKHDPDLWRQRLQGIEADFVCVGHTHMPFHLDLGKTQVINPGSVGHPRDGDPRAAYAIIEDGRVELKRVGYDIRRTLQHLQDAGLPEPLIAYARALLSTGGHADWREFEAATGA